MPLVLEQALAVVTLLVAAGGAALIVRHLHAERANRVRVLTALGPRFGVTNVRASWSIVTADVRGRASSGSLRVVTTSRRNFDITTFEGSPARAGRPWSVASRRLATAGYDLVGAAERSLGGEAGGRFVMRGDAADAPLGGEIEQLLGELDPGLFNVLVGASIPGVHVQCDGGKLHVAVFGQHLEDDAHVERFLTLVELVSARG